MRAAAALALAWSASMADPEQARHYRDQAAIWIWCAEQVEAKGVE
jgi:hypothetical protein